MTTPRNRIAIDAHTCHGAPRLAGTRVPVYVILNSLAEYGSIEEVRRVWRFSFDAEDIVAAIQFAADHLERTYGGPDEDEP